jgi:hypothetical protein
LRSVARHRLDLPEVIAAAACTAGIVLAAARLTRSPADLAGAAPLMIFSIGLGAAAAARLISNQRHAAARQFRTAVFGGSIAGWSFLLLSGREAADAAVLGTLIAAAGTIAAGIREITTSANPSGGRRRLTRIGWKVSFWLVLPSLLLGASAIGAFAANASPRAIEPFGWTVALLASGLGHVTPTRSNVSITARTAAAAAVSIGIFLALLTSGDLLSALLAGLCGASLIDVVVRGWRAPGGDLIDPPVTVSDMRGFLLATWAGTSALGVGLIILAVVRA